MKFWLMAFFLLCVLMPFTSSAYYHRETPKLNLHPKYFLTLSGYIAPELKNKIYLSLKFDYLAMSSKCEHFSFDYMLAGLKSAPTKTDNYWITATKGNHYIIKIPLDKYQTGYCNWQLTDIGLRLSRIKNINTDAQGFISINNKETQKYNPTYYDFLCKNIPESCQLKISKNSLLPIFIGRQQNFKIQVNILKDNNHGDNS